MVHKLEDSYHAPPLLASRETNLCRKAQSYPRAEVLYKQYCFGEYFTGNSFEHVLYIFARIQNSIQLYRIYMLSILYTQ